MAVVGVCALPHGRGAAQRAAWASHEEERGVDEMRYRTAVKTGRAAPLQAPEHCLTASRLEPRFRSGHHYGVNVPAAQPSDCPPLSKSKVTVYARTLHRACEVLGGLDATSRHLGVPAASLTRWIGGVEPPPLEVFLAAVDVVLLAAEPGAGRG